MNYLEDFNLKDKKVLIRSDLNVPIKSGIISSKKRIQASLPTILFAINSGAKVIVTSHLGRPMEGHFTEEESLKPIVKYLSDYLNQDVRLITDWIESPFQVDSGQVVVLENCRFNNGEQENDAELAKKYAELADIFVMDAFGTAHRKHASTYGVAEYSDCACSGILFSSELKALNKVMKDPNHPMVAIVGGSKVSTKLSVLDALSDKVDQLILGGGIANTFLKAQGFEIGKSLCEDDFLTSAEKIIKKLEKRGASLPIISDVICGKLLTEDEPAIIKDISEVDSDDMIFDLGKNSMDGITKIVQSAKTILWNGPIGVFEFKQFSNGTELLADAIAKSNAFSLAGGGDTIAAIEKFKVENNISYISTAGGAFLEFVEGKKLPAIEILEKKCQS
jgi:phosphoglycerate kinase|tara:strand:- start:1697 stop:2872 length:1176 start_codon:yes stop_codon:yes gene_type:complete